LIRAANGGCIGSGFKTARWPILLDEDFSLARKDNLYSLPG